VRNEPLRIGDVRKIVESLEAFVGFTDHKLLLEVFEEVVFGFITREN
jgi:hypothetical protein